MKNLLIVALTALSVTANAQLYVQPTTSEASYVYVNDTFLYVENDVELETNNVSGITNSNFPSILLRNQSQLLQGDATGTNQENKGSGFVSIFQEGTVNQFDYNLWTSPVGLSHVSSGAVAADGNGEFAFQPSFVSGGVSIPQQVFYVPVGPNAETTSNPALIGVGFDGSTMPNMLNIASYWLWSFQSGDGYADWIHITNTGSLDAGYGFTMKGVSGTDTTAANDGVPNNSGSAQRYDFRGRPNSGDIDVIVAAGSETLTGNPYPSALDLSYFLLENSRGATDPASISYSCEGSTTTINRSDILTGIASFWDSDPTVLSHFLEDYQGGYGTYSPMGTTCTGGMYVNATFYMFDENGAQLPGSVGSGVAYDRRFSPVGQGFFVEGSSTQADGNTFTFNNNQRIFIKEGNNSDFRNSDEPQPGIGVSTYYEDVNNMQSFAQVKLNIAVNDTYSRELGIGIMDWATRGYDVAMDAKNSSLLPSDVSFSINEEEDYVINAIPDDEYQWVQLAVSADATTEFKFSVHYTEHFEYEGVFLFDTLTETFYDILNDEAIMLLEAGDYPKRFVVRFTRETETTEEDTEEEEEEEEEEETTENEEEEDNSEWEEEDSEWENESDDTTTNDQEETDSEEEENDTEEEEDTNDDTEDEDDTEEGDTNSDEENTDEEETLNVEEVNPFLEESILESLTVIQNNNSAQLEIRNPKNIALTNVSLFDITGKQIFLEQDLGNKELFTFSTRNLSTGVYVVTFITENGLKKARKLSITNR